MGSYRMIEVDFDVHKLIEAERRSFDESPNDTLRRLLLLPADPVQGVGDMRGSRPWIGNGVVLPHGTQVRMTHGRSFPCHFAGTINNGQWLFNGDTYASPSSAASCLLGKLTGRKVHLNGWSCWTVKRPGDADWTPLGRLRDEANKG